MKAWAPVLLLLLAGCATASHSSAPTGPRAIAGWPGWLCLDFAGSPNMSFWYLTTQTPEEGRAFEGNCDLWARTPPPAGDHPREQPLDQFRGQLATPPDPKLLGPFHGVSSWPGWQCADFKDHRRESVWRSTSKAGPGNEVYPGRCEDWAESHGTVRSSLRAPTYKILGGKGRASLVLDDPIGSAEVSLSLLELEPGAEVPMHEHETSAEILFLDQGSVEMKIAGKRVSARAGDVIHIPAGVKHSAKVVGEVAVQAVQIYSPPGPEQRFTKGERIR